MKCTAARCGAEPLPDEAKLSFPGWRFAASISSLSVVAPSEGLTATTSGEELTLLTGTRSRLASYPSLGIKSGLTRMLDGLAISTVYPSGALLATYSAAMLEPAPGRLSITIGCPRPRESGSPSVRATKSAAPAGANPTTSLIGRDGKG